MVKLKKAVLTAAFALALAASPMQPAMAAADQPREIPMGSFPGEISPQSDNLRWIYDARDGKLYKRLLNTSTNSWVGDWIYVRDI